MSVFPAELGGGIVYPDDGADLRLSANTYRPESCILSFILWSILTRKLLILSVFGSDTIVLTAFRMNFPALSGSGTQAVMDGSTLKYLTIFWPAGLIGRLLTLIAGSRI